MIVNLYTLNTKKNFFLLFDDILPVFESFQVSPKILIFEISYFLSKRNFFDSKTCMIHKKVNHTSLETIMSYSNQKAEKKIFIRSGVISILVKWLKKRKNRNISGNIEFHGLKLG
jgi:hypothetical protein